MSTLSFMNVNERLWLEHRNEFICAWMVLMQNFGIEGPRMHVPRQKEDVSF